MPANLEVLFAPAEFAALPSRDLSDTVCVVFDILRATSTIVTALANGAAAIIPVAEISDAIALRRERPDVLLAGEREGLRIRASMSGGIDFDFGNSPREFLSPPANLSPSGRTIILTTTNGSRALRACSGAKAVLACSFLNLTATARHLEQTGARNILLVCSGTGQQTAHEDVLGAGALAALLESRFSPGETADSANIARHIYQRHENDLAKALADSRNGRRLLGIPELRDDVAWCARSDIYPVVVELRSSELVLRR